MFLLVKCNFATKKTRKYDNAEKLFFDSVLHQKNPAAEEWRSTYRIADYCKRPACRVANQAECSGETMECRQRLRHRQGQEDIGAEPVSRILIMKRFYLHYLLIISVFVSCSFMYLKMSRFLHKKRDIFILADNSKYLDCQKIIGLRTKIDFLQTIFIGQ